MGLLVALIVGVEVVDRVRDWVAKRRSGLSGRMDKPGDLRVRKPDTELRRHYPSEDPKISREQRANEPTRHGG